MRETLQVQYFVLKKIRHADKEIEIPAPTPENFSAYTPVIVDDIISTGQTLIKASKQLQKMGIKTLYASGYRRFLLMILMKKCEQQE